jgi:hypothetical protein
VRRLLVLTIALAGVLPALPAWSASGWVLQVSRNPSRHGANLLYGVAAISASDAWAVGFWNRPGDHHSHTLAEHWDGTRWRTVRTPDRDTRNAVNAVSASATDDVWLVGNSNGSNGCQTLVERWDGTSWKLVPSANPAGNCPTLLSVAARAPDEVWAVGQYFDPEYGYRCFAEHWDGTSWILKDKGLPVDVTRLTSVSVDPAGHVWAVGDQYVARWYRGSWHDVTPVFEPGVDEYRAILALSGNDVWAVGSQGFRTFTMHWDGSLWTHVASPSKHARDHLLSVAATRSHDVWAAGWDESSQGVVRTLILHWNGSRWSVQASPDPGATVNYLTGISGAAGGTAVWTVGFWYLSIGQVPTLIAERAG